MLHSRYIECKAEAYRQMNIALKSAAYLCALSNIYNALPPIQRYAVAVDTLDYMLEGYDGFNRWYFSDYAQITMSVLQELFCVAVATIDDIEDIRVLYAVERAIERTRWLLKDKQKDELDSATANELGDIHLQYRKLQARFIAVMKQWFEAQS